MTVKSASSWAISVVMSPPNTTVLPARPWLSHRARGAERRTTRFAEEGIEIRMRREHRGSDGDSLVERGALLVGNDLGAWHLGQERFFKALAARDANLDEFAIENGDLGRILFLGDEIISGGITQLVAKIIGIADGIGGYEVLHILSPRQVL